MRTTASHVFKMLFCQRRKRRHGNGLLFYTSWYVLEHNTFNQNQAKQRKRKHPAGRPVSVCAPRKAPAPCEGRKAGSALYHLSPVLRLRDSITGCTTARWIKRAWIINYLGTSRPFNPEGFNPQQHPQGAGRLPSDCGPQGPCGSWGSSWEHRAGDLPHHPTHSNCLLGAGSRFLCLFCTPDGHNNAIGREGLTSKLRTWI